MKKEFKIGDKVKFGYYGYFDDDEIYTIVEINSTTPLLGNKEYTLENSRHCKLTAYSDEIMPA